MMKSNIDTVDFYNNLGKTAYIYPIGGTDTFSIIFTGGLCFIPVKIDTIELPLANFDTGAEQSLFDIDSLNIPIGKNFEIKNIIGDTIKTQEIFPDSIIIGKTVVKQNMQYIGYHNRYNVIGTDVIKNFVWKIDNLHSKLYFSIDTSAFSHKDCVEIPFWLEYDKPVIKCFIDDVAYNVIVDTGNDSFLDLWSGNPFYMLEELEVRKPKDSIYVNTFFFNNLKDYKNSRIIRKTITISNIKIGEITLNNEIVKYNSVKANTLGWDFIQRFDYVILDYINKKLYLGPMNKYKSFTYITNVRRYVNSLGIEIDPYDFEITALSDSLINQGISLGDTVIAINEKPTTHTKSMKTEYSDDIVKLKIKTESQIKDITLHRKYRMPEPDTVMSYNRCYLLPLYNRFEYVKDSDNGYFFKYFDLKYTKNPDDNLIEWLFKLGSRQL